MIDIVENPPLIIGIVTLALSVLAAVCYIWYYNYMSIVSVLDTNMIMMSFLVGSITLIVMYIIKYPTFRSADSISLALIYISVVFDSIVVTKLLCSQ